MLVYTTADGLGGLHNTCCETFEAAILGGFHFAELYESWRVEILMDVNCRSQFK